VAARNALHLNTVAAAGTAGSGLVTAERVSSAAIPALGDTAAWRIAPDAPPSATAADAVSPGAASAQASTPSVVLNLTAGQSVASQDIVLSNVGTASMTVGVPLVSGDGWSLASTNCGATLAAGASCATTVAYLSTTAGTFEGALTLPHGAPGGPAFVSLTAQVSAVHTFAPSLFDPATRKYSTGIHRLQMADSNRRVDIVGGGLGAITNNVPLSTTTKSYFEIQRTAAGSNYAVIGLGFGTQPTFSPAVNLWTTSCGIYPGHTGQLLRDGVASGGNSSGVSVVNVAPRVGGMVIGIAWDPFTQTATFYSDGVLSGTCRLVTTQPIRLYVGNNASSHAGGGFIARLHPDDIPGAAPDGYVKGFVAD